MKTKINRGNENGSSTIIRALICDGPDCGQVVWTEDSNNRSHYISVRLQASEISGQVGREIFDQERHYCFSCVSNTLLDIVVRYNEKTH